MRAFATAVLIGLVVGGAEAFYTPPASQEYSLGPWSWWNIWRATSDPYGRVSRGTATTPTSSPKPSASASWSDGAVRVVGWHHKDGCDNETADTYTDPNIPVPAYDIPPAPAQLPLHPPPQPQYVTQHVAAHAPPVQFITNPGQEDVVATLAGVVSSLVKNQANSDSKSSSSSSSSSMPRAARPMLLAQHSTQMGEESAAAPSPPTTRRMPDHTAITDVPPLPLTNGWTAYFSPQHSQFYYHHAEKGTIQWHPPPHTVHPLTDPATTHTSFRVDQNKFYNVNDPTFVTATPTPSPFGYYEGCADNEDWNLGTAQSELPDTCAEWAQYRSDLFDGDAHMSLPPALFDPRGVEMNPSASVVYRQTLHSKLGFVGRFGCFGVGSGANYALSKERKHGALHCPVLCGTCCTPPVGEGPTACADECDRCISLSEVQDPGVRAVRQKLLRDFPDVYTEEQLFDMTRHQLDALLHHPATKSGRTPEDNNANTDPPPPPPENTQRPEDAPVGQAVSLASKVPEALANKRPHLNSVAEHSRDSTLLDPSPDIVDAGQHGESAAAACVDLDTAGQTNSAGKSCVDYHGNEHLCDQFDDDDFVACTMCCACKFNHPSCLPLPSVAAQAVQDDNPTHRAWIGRKSKGMAGVEEVVDLTESEPQDLGGDLAIKTALAAERSDVQPNTPPEQQPPRNAVPPPPAPSTAHAPNTQPTVAENDNNNDNDNDNKNSNRPFTARAGPAVDLPHGWEATWHADSGKYYYSPPDRSRSQWYPPAGYRGVVSSDDDHDHVAPNHAGSVFVGDHQTHVKKQGKKSSGGWKATGGGGPSFEWLRVWENKPKSSM